MIILLYLLREADLIYGAGIIPIIQRRGFLLGLMVNITGLTMREKSINWDSIWLWIPKVLPEQSPLIRRIIYIPLLILFFGGLFLNRERLKELIPLILPIVGFTFIYSVTFVLPRYRIPIEPLMFILSMDCVRSLLQKIT